MVKCECERCEQVKRLFNQDRPSECNCPTIHGYGLDGFCIDCHNKIVEEAIKDAYERGLAD